MVMMTALHRRLAFSHRAVTAFRSWLGAVVIFELLERLAALRWLYTDVGAFPRWAVMPPSDVAPVLHVLCVHAWSGDVLWQYALVGAQAVAAVALCAGARPRAAAAVCWALHWSSMLRNPQLSFIFDRYLHVLLLLAACMPTDRARPRVSAATCALAAQLLLIYVDAGYHKLTSPDAAWSVGAEVAALDTYLRHTPVARLTRWLLGARGLRYAGAAAAWLELAIAPLALAAPTQTARRCCIAAAVSLHVGIAMTMRNTVALSAAAVAAWIPLIDGPLSAEPPSQLPPGTPASRAKDAATEEDERASGTADHAVIDGLSAALVWLLALGSAWHQFSDFGAPACAASASGASDLVQATLLHNRWNVFTGAEPFVVWEVAPARLDDGSIVDLWRGTDAVAWDVPRGRAPSIRAGRWRSWPYLAERTTEADAVFWGALCDEWESRDGRQVVSFVFYLMQADVVPFDAAPAELDASAASTSEPAASTPWAGYLPEYGNVRKRRLRQFSCLERRHGALRE